MDKRMGNLEGRVAVVTGSERGIGAATARRMTDDGAAFALLDVQEALCDESMTAIRADGGTALALGCDVTRADDVEAAFTRIGQEFGRLDILVNNAGVLRDNLLFKMSEDDWDTVMAVHLKGSFLCSRAAQHYMVQQKYGKIV